MSFGYLVKQSHRDDGVEVLTELDLYEVSIVPAPANQDTRILSMKSAQQDDATFDLLDGSEAHAVAGKSDDRLRAELGLTGKKSTPLGPPPARGRRLETRRGAGTPIRHLG